MKPIIFPLTTAIKYAGPAGAGLIECNFIELREPNGKLTHLCTDIESKIQTPIMNMASNLDQETIAAGQAQAAADKEKEGDEVKDLTDEDRVEEGRKMLVMMTSSGADMRKITLLMREVFRSVALMDGEKAITEPRLDEMSNSDLKLMMGVYVANFIVS